MEFIVFILFTEVFLNAYCQGVQPLSEKTTRILNQSHWLRLELDCNVAGIRQVETHLIESIILPLSFSTKLPAQIKPSQEDQETKSTSLYPLNLEALLDRRLEINHPGCLTLSRRHTSRPTTPKGSLTVVVQFSVRCPTLG